MMGAKPFMSSSSSSGAATSSWSNSGKTQLAGGGHHGGDLPWDLRHQDRYPAVRTPPPPPFQANSSLLSEVVLPAVIVAVVVVISIFAVVVLAVLRRHLNLAESSSSSGSSSASAGCMAEYMVPRRRTPTSSSTASGSGQSGGGSGRRCPMVAGSCHRSSSEANIDEVLLEDDGEGSDYGGHLLGPDVVDNHHPAAANPDASLYPGRAFAPGGHRLPSPSATPVATVSNGVVNRDRHHSYYHQSGQDRSQQVGGVRNKVPSSTSWSSTGLLVAKGVHHANPGPDEAADKAAGGAGTVIMEHRHFRPISGTTLNSLNLLMPPLFEAPRSTTSGEDELFQC